MKPKNALFCFIFASKKKDYERLFGEIIIFSLIFSSSSLSFLRWFLRIPFRMKILFLQTFSFFFVSFIYIGHFYSLKVSAFNCIQHFHNNSIKNLGFFYSYCFSLGNFSGKRMFFP